MLVYGRLAADMCAWTEIARSGIFAESKDMFSHRISGLAVKDPIVHTSVETAGQSAYKDVLGQPHHLFGRL
jgi:hypothetical protein